MRLTTVAMWLPCMYMASIKIQRRRPRFKPETVLDFGSGIGTAIWYQHAMLLPTLHICLNMEMYF